MYCIAVPGIPSGQKNYYYKYYYRKSSCPFEKEAKPKWYFPEGPRKKNHPKCLTSARTISNKFRHKIKILTIFHSKWNRIWWRSIEMNQYCNSGREWENVYGWKLFWIYLGNIWCSWVKFFLCSLAEGRLDAKK